MVEESENTPMRTEEEEGSGSGSGSGSDADSGEEEEQVEWLATTRAKRSNAGNRLHSLLQQEDPDDELELLFQEDEDDVGFSDVEGDQSDVQMDSSDDDEDQGPAAGDDDLDGEKELQRQAKVEKAKKRKMEGGMPKIFKKRVKIDPTISNAPAPRLKKKSERASWLPTAEEAPTRASGRQSTKMMKRQLHEQMVDREIKRLKQLANMERAAAAKEAAKKPALTQADRLAEAARVEKANSKSLSRWEEAEQQREEEQKAKLLALKNRTLNGPVITIWSGMGEWVGGKLRQVGKILVVEEKEKPVSKKRKAVEMEADSEAGSVIGAPSKPDITPLKTGDVSMDKAGMKDVGQSSSTAHEASTSLPTITKSLTPAPEQERTPVPEASSQPPKNSTTPSTSTVVAVPAPPKVVPASHYNYGPPNSSVLAPPAGLPLFAPPPPMPNAPLSQPPLYPPFALAPPMLDGSAPVPGLGYYPPQPQRSTPSSTPYTLNNNAQPPPPPQPPTPPAIEYATKNCIILSNFDELAIKEKIVQNQILFGAGRKFLKCPKPKNAHESCVITSLPAKYRDPDTGLPFHDAYAYKEIQKLKRGEYKWSKLLGVYVGMGTYAARGVPERFRDALPKPKILPAKPPTPATLSDGK